MAEGLLRSVAPEGVNISSAGIGALVGEPADPIAVQLLQDRGIDISGHRARQLTPEIVREADLVLVMERKHLHAVNAISPGAWGKVHEIGKWIDAEVPDPYRKSPEYFKQVLELLERGVETWSKKIWR